MRIRLDDYGKPAYLETEDGNVGIYAGLGVVREPNGDLEYVSLHMPGDRTYVARDTTTGDHTIVVLPKGLTPEHFGWKGWQFIKLSVLIDQVEEGDVE